jgi:hypothetical protein
MRHRSVTYSPESAFHALFWRASLAGLKNFVQAEYAKEAAHSKKH